MKARVGMYIILKDMVSYALSGNWWKVTNLNQDYSALVPLVYRLPLTKIDEQYENCRKMCLDGSPSVLDVVQLKRAFDNIPNPVLAEDYNIPENIEKGEEAAN